MSRSKGRREDGRRDTKQRTPEERRAGQPEADRDAQGFARETGYQPSVNQQRDEPLPASHHADSGQEAVKQNEEQAGNHRRAAPSPRARGRG
jgi:hypothetical protein